MSKKRKLKRNVKLLLAIIIVVLVFLCIIILSRISNGDNISTNVNIKYKSVDNFKLINKNLDCTDKVISIGKIKEVNDIKLAYSCNSDQIVFYKENVIISNVFIDNFVSFYNVDKYLVIKYSLEDSKEYNYDILDEKLNKVNALELDDSILNEVYDV